MAEEQYRLRGWLTEGATDDRRLSMLLRTVELPARSQGQVLFGGDELIHCQQSAPTDSVQLRR